MQHFKSHRELYVHFVYNVLVSIIYIDKFTDVYCHCKLSARVITQNKARAFSRELFDMGGDTFSIYY